MGFPHHFHLEKCSKMVPLGTLGGVLGALWEGMALHSVPKRPPRVPKGLPRYPKRSILAYFGHVFDCQATILVYFLECLSGLLSHCTLSQGAVAVGALLL